ncbi:putative reverse transcriptase domain-containing protein [Tanacetum coccineum]
MRQRHWIELFSDYDCEIRYHPGKANVVADALSRKERVKPKRVRAMNMILQSSIKDRILAAQKDVVDEFSVLQKGLDEMIEQRSDGTLYYLDRIWVPLKGEVRTLIMDEAHKLKYSVHPGADKMYYDLRHRHWWPRMKKDIVEYFSKCLTCLKKSYADKRRKPLEFSVGDYVLLKVPPWKGVVRFWKKGKLAPRFVGPFEIIEKVGPVAYRLDLLEELNGVHDTFHVSNLKKCLADPTLKVPLDEIRVDVIISLSLSPPLIPVEDNDSRMEEIDLFLASDDSIQRAIKKDDYDSEGDIGISEHYVLMPNILLTLPTLDPDSDFTPYHDSLGSGNKIFYPGIFIEVQSKRLLSRDEFSISFIRDPLSSVFDTLLPFSSKNEDKVFNLEIPSGEIKVHIEVLSVLWGNRLPILDDSLSFSRYKGLKAKQKRRLSVKI